MHLELHLDLSVNLGQSLGEKWNPEKDLGEIVIKVITDTGNR